MEHIEDSAVLGACEGRSLIYTCAPAAFRPVAKSTTTLRGSMLSRGFAPLFSPYKCVGDVLVVYMRFMVFREKCGLISPSTGEIVSVCLLFQQ